MIIYMKMQIYQPEQDSYLLQSELIKFLQKQKKSNKNKELKILDMGTGSGIQALTCSRLGFKNIIAADINKDAVENLKKQDKKIKAVYSDLFSDIHADEKFDLIIFNPPYLPEHKYDKEKDTTGGKKGYETITRFLKQAKNHLDKNGKILLLFSSLSKPGIIKTRMKKLNYESRLLAKKRIFFEELYVYEIYNKK